MLQPTPSAPAQSQLAEAATPSSELLLWCGEPGAAPAHPNLLLWQGSARGPGERSLVEYIEVHAVEVRRRYLEWAHELGEREVSGRKLRDYFSLGRDGSFWWYAMFVEQSAWKQRSLEKLIKLLALELLLQREAPAQLSYAGNDRESDRVLHDLCTRASVRYCWVRTADGLSRARTMHLRLPRTLKGVIALIHFGRLWLLLRGAAAVRAPRSPSMLLCGQFANHNAGQEKTPFRSRFWGPLPELMRAEGYEVQWLHIFYATDLAPTASVARRRLRFANEHQSQSGQHMFVESLLPSRGLMRVALRWMRVTLKSLHAGWVLRRRFAGGDGAIYWPVIRDDWADAFRGFDCVQNLFYAECFTRALQRLPRYDECLYLMENHAWERALARAWRASGHGRLTGVAHSTVRFWDLRYHCDPRRYLPPYCELLPRPDCVVVNSRAAREAYLASCAPREPLLECEALRYLHLAAGRPRDLTEVSRGRPLRVLVLGDYTRERTEVLLGIAERLTRSLEGPLEIAIKPHPGCPLPVHTARDLRVTNTPLEQLVADAHFVLASNTTSAALEAYVSGARLLVLDDHSGVNYSPLRGIAGVSFVRDADEIVRAVTAGEAEGRQPKADGFFNIDPQLPRWRDYFHVRRAATYSRNSA